MKAMVKLFNYEGNEVTFRNENGIAYANATEMAKQFGKRPVDWLKYDNSNQFISKLSEVRNITSTDLVIVKKGGHDQGTWMHEDVAIEFARWLSPAFAIWCNDRIKELLTVGMTATQPTLDEMISNPDLIIGLASKLKQLREENAQKEAELELANRTIKEQAPAADYTMKVLSAPDLTPITIIAKDHGMSANALNNFLHRKGVQYKQGETWVLYAKYQDKGYTKSRTHTYYDKSNELRTSIHTYWTERGRAFIHNLLNPLRKAN